MAHISAVIPLYNEEQCLDELHRRLTAALDAVNPDYEVVFIDDGSRDRTWQAVVKYAGQNKRVKGMRFSRNFGQHYCITAGLDACDGDWVVIMDGDLQDQPEEISRLYSKAQEGFDVVLARRGRRRDSLWKRLTSGLFYAVFNYLTEMHYDREVGNFRIISRRVAENFRAVREQLRFVGGVIDWLGFPQARIDVRHAERFGGKGAYNFRRQWRLAQDIIMAYSDKPLRLAVRVGFAISGLAFLYGLYVIYQALTHRVAIVGWSSLIASLYFLAGIIISILGVIGMYLGRTFSEAKRRPLYIVMDRINV